MDWWKTKKSRSLLKKERSVREFERGAILLEELIQCCDGKSNPIKFFSADQILEATDTFSDSNRVSELYDDFPFDWYSGKERNDINHTILLLIKKWKNRLNDKNRGNFCRDIAISSMVSNHKNFMKLVGCGLESEHPVLVYRAMEMKPSRLDMKLIVSWRKRLKIAEEIATALAYLHTAFPRPFVYRIMRLEEILLDEDGVAKLCNFSHCISIPQGETFVKLGFGCIGGDYDYMDDNYLINGVVSEKTDVYGFGIFMLKLLTGEEKFREIYSGNERKFPNWLSKSYEDGRIDEIVDLKMLEEMGEVSEDERCRLEAFLVLSERCIGDREVPNMVQVAKELKRFLENDSASSSNANALCIT